MRGLVAALQIMPVLAGCTSELGGDGIPFYAELRRESDNAVTRCMTGSYPAGGVLPTLAGSERRARRMFHACVLACRDAGFQEINAPEVIKEPDSFGAEEKLNEAPDECRPRVGASLRVRRVA